MFLKPWELSNAYIHRINQPCNCILQHNTHTYLPTYQSLTIHLTASGILEFLLEHRSHLLHQPGDVVESQEDQGHCDKVTCLGSMRERCVYVDGDEEEEEEEEEENDLSNKLPTYLP